MRHSICPHRTLALLGLVMLSIFPGCRTPPPPALTRFEFKQPHMGTLFTITLYAPDAATARRASEAAFARIAALNATMTDYDPESELMRLSRAPIGVAVPVSADLFNVLQKGQRLAALSDGAFDVTIGPVVRQWRRARRTGELPPPAALAHARALVGWHKLRLDAPTRSVMLLAPEMQLDLGGIAKGYAADAALVVLKSQGCGSALVAASGDIAVGEAPPGKTGWRVSIGSPVPSPVPAGEPTPATRSAAAAPLAQTLLLKNAAVSTSGDAEQFVEIDGVRYSHIVNPHTGVGLTNQLQVTIVAPHATETDALATTVCVLGIDRGLSLVESQPDTAALILYRAEGRLITVESRRMKSVPRTH